MLQLFYRQESKGTRYLIGRYLIGRYLFFSLFSVFFTFGRWVSPIQTAPFRAKPLQVSFFAHIDTFLISVLQTLHVCPMNVCNSEHYLLLNWEQKKCPRRICCFKWQDWIECAQFRREWNNYLPKAGKLNVHRKAKKNLEGFQEINSNSGFFLPKEHTHRKLFTLKFTGLLNQILFLNVPLPTHPCNAPFLSTAQFE